MVYMYICVYIYCIYIWDIRLGMFLWYGYPYLSVISDFSVQGTARNLGTHCVFELET